MCVGRHVIMRIWVLTEVLGSSRGEVTGSCKLPNTGPRNQTQALCQSSKDS